MKWKIKEEYLLILLYVGTIILVIFIDQLMN